jgi:hypothetical protein
MWKPDNQRRQRRTSVLKHSTTLPREPGRAAQENRKARDLGSKDGYDTVRMRLAPRQPGSLLLRSPKLAGLPALIEHQIATCHSLGFDAQDRAASIRA